MGKRPSINRSQAIRPFGPGALIELQGHTLLHGIANHWYDNSVGSDKLEEQLIDAKVYEIRLQKLLGVDYFLQLPTAPDIKTRSIINGYRFPRWASCPKCKNFGNIGNISSNINSRAPLKCAECKTRLLIPARLIVTCINGHLSDFPWYDWVHLDEACTNVEPMKFVTSNKSGRLSDIRVSCECGKSRNLSKATNNEYFEDLAEKYPDIFRCKGLEPWRGTEYERQSCDEPLRPSQRGATDLYFPYLISSIAVPPFTTNFEKFIEKNWSKYDILSDEPDMFIRAWQLSIRKEGLENSETEILNDIKNKLEHSRNINLEILDLQEHIELRKKRNETYYSDEFHAETIIPVSNKLISRVTKIHKMRDITILVGFTRLNPVPLGLNLNISGDSNIFAQFADMDINCHPSVDFNKFVGDTWYPCLENKGEGIYIELNRELSNNWANQPEITERMKILESKLIESALISNDIEINPQLILAHSLSHALINELTLKSGYSSSSLRERIYQNEIDGELVTGFLIYTSSSDSSGTLGGLVRQGNWDKLYSVLERVKREMNWCSSDPLCSRQAMRGLDGVNLTACHACLIISETSCTMRNSLLDRVMLIGTIENPSIGFLNL